jgi:ATP-binding protein involved in chromosome partitioning
MAKASVVPYAITRQDDGVRIEWVAGEHEGFFPARPLRLACPCAACVEEMSGRPLLDPATVAPDIHPRRLELVGAYGLRIRWSDGHDTGIYTFQRLLEACPCSACAARRAGTASG